MMGHDWLDLLVWVNRSLAESLLELVVRGSPVLEEVELHEFFLHVLAPVHVSEVGDWPSILIK